MPLHPPARPQVAGGSAGQSLWGSSPTGACTQVPTRPGTLQAEHIAVQALLQQTPSTQKPLWQSAAFVQAVPIGCVPPVIIIMSGGGAVSGGSAGVVSRATSRPASRAGLPPVPPTPKGGGKGSTRQASATTERQSQAKGRDILLADVRPAFIARRGACRLHAIVATRGVGRLKIPTARSRCGCTMPPQ
jgi:hypothetical protein